MAIHKVALLLVFGMILLASDFEHADAKAWTKESDRRIDYGICPYLGTKKVGAPLCVNCCSGKIGCKYFNKDGTFICDGGSARDGKKACTKECDPRIDIGFCAYVQTKIVNGLSTNCSAGKKGCKYFSNDGTYICDGESEWLSERENDLQKSNVLIS
ncbi:hypothetical protein H5410_056032 [Solanum commersonii]|uniref:Uncharacterized protein n=1 Tax=Solanum commersonii TaxID=4109 RepID=A0A9J5WK33_SOLCO|nr:hypothetical protein H5410_056032 [Solanum commersonii]